MKEPQHLRHEYLENWTLEDIEVLKNIYTGLSDKEEAVELWKEGTMVRIADAGDYDYVYEDLIRHEAGMSISFDEFMQEFKKGYGKAKYNEISRLFELSNGIWYDAAYC